MESAGGAIQVTWILWEVRVVQRTSVGGRLGAEVNIINLLSYYSFI